MILDQKAFTPRHATFLQFGIDATLRMEYDQEVMRLKKAKKQVSLDRLWN